MSATRAGRERPSRTRGSIVLNAAQAPAAAPAFADPAVAVTGPSGGARVGKSPTPGAAFRGSERASLC